MRYLTRSYVEYLGLEVVPILARRNDQMVIRPYGEMLPKPSHIGYAQGVIFNDIPYIREPDGLCFTR